MRPLDDLNYRLLNLLLCYTGNDASLLRTAFEYVDRLHAGADKSYRLIQLLAFIRHNRPNIPSLGRDAYKEADADMELFFQKYVHT